MVRHQKVDWQIVLAEMNGYDFNFRVLSLGKEIRLSIKPYGCKSDVPAHEGPTNHAVLEFWSYDFPLTNVEEKRLESELSIIPPFLTQARKNLTVMLEIYGLQELKILKTKKRI